MLTVEVGRTPSTTVSSSRAKDGTAVATIEQGRVTANGVDFGYLSCGDGPLALCLHGFPDSARGADAKTWASR